MTIKIPEQLSYFQTFGFIVLRQFFEPTDLAQEIETALREGIVPATEFTAGAVTRFQYLPLMSSKTPASLSLLDRLEPIAQTLLGQPVIPTRAKAVRYSGNTIWHADSSTSLASLGCAAYLEALGPESGALRVLPGSHHAAFAQALQTQGIGPEAQSWPGHVLSSQPGDLLLFDEHLFHASCGGGLRRQWRVDFLCDPVGPQAEQETQAYFASIFPEHWNGGYDPNFYPSYGSDWQHSSRRAARRLQELGVYELAQRQEDFMRAQQHSP